MYPYTKAENWNGEGTPPVGSLCEYDDYGVFVRTIILGHHPCYKDRIWHRAEFGGFSTGDSYSADSITSFRAVLTPEQMAERKRLDAIATINSIIESCQSTEEAAERLYDHGYRLVED